MRSTRWRRLLGSVLLGGLSLVALPRDGAARTGETLGLLAPPVTPVDVPDAWAWDINPGAAGLQPAWSVVLGGAFVGRTTVDPGTPPSAIRRGAPGAGGYAHLPIAFGLSAGFGLSYLTTGAAGDDDRFRYTRLTLGAAYALGKRIGIGFSYHHLYAEDAPLGGVDTWDAGLVVRLAPALAFAAAVHDIGDPVYRDPDTPDGRTKTPREWTIALGIRPLPYRHPLTLTIGSRITEPGLDDALRLAPFANLELRVASGLLLRAEVEVPLLPDDPDFLEPRITAGLELALGSVGMGGAGFAELSGDASAGGMVYASIYGEKVGPPFRRKRIVELSLGGTLEELRGSSGPLVSAGGRTHLELLLTLNRLASAPDVEAVVLRLRGLKIGIGQLYELVEAIQALKAVGKNVYCHGDGAGTRGVALCSHADRFAVSPPANIRLLGLLSEITFYRGAFDKILVEPEFIRFAEYKSSPEVFTEKGPTPENKAVREETLTNLYDVLLESMAAGYGLDKTEVVELVDAGPYTPTRALGSELIDSVSYFDDFKRTILEAHKGARWVDGDRVPRARVDAWPRNRAIAVLVVEGAITDGRSTINPLSGRRSTGGVTLAKAIKGIAASPRYAAIVVRINSPGGSALASDLVWKELEQAAKRKPVIISMGDICASGGYYIASAGEEIYATPGTITGSIGIYTGKFNLKGLYDWAGMHVETFKRGEHADIFSMSRPLTAEERVFAMENLRYYYDLFLSRVATSRKMETDAVDRIARGHVWTGRAAREIGLVDTTGGLTAAVARAKARAGIRPNADIPIEVFPKPPGGILNVALRWLGIGRAESGSLAGLFARKKDDPAIRAAASLAEGVTRAAAALLPTWATFDPGTPLALWDDGDFYVPGE